MTAELQSAHSKGGYKFFQKPIVYRSLMVVFILASIGGVGVGISQFTNQSQKDTSKVLTAKVERRNMSVSFSVNGTVKAERTINVSPKSSGYLKQLLVAEGDSLEQGQIVAYMDDSNLQGQLIQSRAQLAQAEANLNKLLNGTRLEEVAQAEAQLLETQARLEQLQAGNRSQEIEQVQARLSQANAKLRQAEDDLQRNQLLFNEGAISEQTVNQKRADRDTLKAQVVEAKAALNLSEQGSRPEEISQAQAQVEQRRQALNLLQAGTRPEEIDAARAQVDSAKGALQTIETQIKDAVIRAPFDGIVTKKYADPGSFVTPTTAGSSVEGSSSSSIFTLASKNQVISYVDEAKIAKIKLGQTVKLKADAYPDRTFEGTISQIAAQATTVQNVTSFEIKINLESLAQELLKAGMNVEAEIQLGQLNNVLVAPSAGIVRQSNGTAGVYVMGEENKAIFKPLEIGTTIGDRTEIKSGLRGDEQVLISFPPGMEPKPQVRGPLGGIGGNNRNSRPSQSNDR
ncbi:MAG TPA: efflux RND transporter periplasmic adaptor subunit [Halomicronema sp.]